MLRLRLLLLRVTLNQIPEQVVLCDWRVVPHTPHRTVTPTERDSGLKDGIHSDAVGRGFPDPFYGLRKALRDAVSIEKMLPEWVLQSGPVIFKKLMLMSGVS